jgi:hypothetical protein
MCLLKKYTVIALVILLVLINFSSITTKSDSVSKVNSSDFNIIDPGQYLYDSSSDLNFPSNLVFTENLGQLENDDVRYYDRGGSVWFTDDGIWLRIDGREERGEGGLVVKQEFVGANSVRPEGRDAESWYSNFFYGNEPSKWRSYVQNYQEVYYENLYDGIDLKYYTNEAGLKYDFIVKPGADITKIRIKYDGANNLLLTPSGNLEIVTDLGNINENGLYIYQEIRGTEVKVEGKFIIYSDLDFGFSVQDDYDDSKILVIDPILGYSTFIGGDSTDRGYDIYADSNGNAYITGTTGSSNFPNSTGAYDKSFNGYLDAFVFKMNPGGSGMVYSTLIGGNDEDIARGIEVDSSGNVYITGHTKSPDFPNSSGAFDNDFNGTYDAFIVKLNSTGTSLVYSTYLGGSTVDFGYGIALDSSSNVFVTGTTYSSDFPTSPNANDTSLNNDDIFVFKLDSTGTTMLYSTYVGGTDKDFGWAIAIDSAGNAYVTGQTFSDNFPVTPQAYDSTMGSNGDTFIFKLNNDGSEIIYCTYIGNTLCFHDYGNAIAVDEDGFAYIVGNTDSNSFPTTSGAYDESFNGKSSTPGGDIFVTKINQTGSELVYSTFIGGSKDDFGEDIAVDDQGYAIITGYSASTDFPFTPDALDGSYNGGTYDSIFTILNEDGTDLIYSTYLGGLDEEKGLGGVVDDYNNIYLTGSTKSSDFFTSPGSFDTSINGFVDTYVIKFGSLGFVNISSFDILMENNSVSTIYSNYKPYTFRVEINDSYNLPDLSKTMLVLDPTGVNIQLEWDEQSSIFSELSDPDDYIIIDPSSSAVYNSSNKWIINFNLTFNWTYPDENSHDVHVKITNSFNKFTWKNLTGIYNVENDLVFDGLLVVKDESYRVLKNNDMVAGEEKLNWSGLWPEYQGSPNLYPPEDEFDVTVWNENGDSWSSSPTSGAPFQVEMILGNETNLSGENFTINLTGIPPGCDATDTVFKLRIDNDNVTFHDPTPDSNLWQNHKIVEVGIAITDTGGALVEGSSIIRAFSTDNGTSWSTWIGFSGIESANTVTAQTNVALEEGTDNLIKWQARDTLGNGPEESDWYRIKVDTGNVIFTDPRPLETDISPMENVEFGINISDTLSGVNASSIEYSVSLDNGNSWSSWKQVAGFQNSQVVNAYVTETFQDGSGNRIKWRATDLAGNGPTESPVFQISVNIVQVSLPKVNLLYPLNRTMINSSSIELKWSPGTSSLDGLTYNVYFGEDPNPGLYLEGITDTALVITGLEDTKRYFWRVIPNASGVLGKCTSGIWRFDVKILSVGYGINIEGTDTISMRQGEENTFELTITNLGDLTDTIDLTIEENNISKYASLDYYSISNLNSGRNAKRNLILSFSDNVIPGDYFINVTAVSKGSGGVIKDRHSINVKIISKESEDTDTGGEKTDPDSKSSNNLANMMYILIIIVIIVIVMFIVFKQKKRKDSKEESLRTAEPEAGNLETVIQPEPEGLPAESTNVAPEQLEVIPSPAAPAAEVQPEPAPVPQVPQPVQAAGTQQVVAPTPTIADASLTVEEPTPQVPVPDEPEAEPEPEARGPEPEIKPVVQEEANVDELSGLPIAGVTKPVPKKDDEQNN